MSPHHLLTHLFVMQPSSTTPLPLPTTLDPRPCFPTSRPLSQLFLPTDLLQLRQPTNPPFVENKFAHESSQICFTTSPSQPIVQLSKTLHCLSAKRRDKCQRYPKCKSISTNLLFSFSLQVSFQSIQTSFLSSDLCFHCRAEQ